MKMHVDKKLGGTVFLGDSALDVARYAETEPPAGNRQPISNRHWIGHPEMTGWNKIAECFVNPWPAGVETVRKMTDELRHAVPEPRTVRRRPRWADDDGEVDCDRAIRGDENYMRRTFRESAHGPTNVAILLHTGGLSKYTSTQLFWRGAVAAAACELLEVAGYSCEVWCFNLGLNVSQTGDYRSAWIQWRVKEAGDFLDLDSLAKCTSGWFFRSAVFGARAHVPFRLDPSYGRTIDHKLIPAAWFDYMDVSHGFRRLIVPTVYDRDAAVAGAIAALETLKTEYVETE